jgi:hypothetical protein
VQSFVQTVNFVLDFALLYELDQVIFDRFNRILEFMSDIFD